MKNEKEQTVIKSQETATEMLKTLLHAGGSPLDMINTIAHLSGMVACGLAFTVKGNVKPRRKAYQVQTDIAKATRNGIEKQAAEAFEHLTFEPMFVKDEQENNNEVH